MSKCSNDEKSILGFSSPLIKLDSGKSHPLNTTETNDGDVLRVEDTNRLSQSKKR